MPSTSTLGPGVPVSGTIFSIGNGASPDSYTQIANACELKLPIINETTDVTNFGDFFRRRIATLSDMGKISFKIYWEMRDPTHDNVSGGLRYVLVNKLVRDFQVTYPDGNNSTDTFPAYVTGFMVTGAIGKVWEAEIELSNSGPPTLV
jgi:hypothetical protein